MRDLEQALDGRLALEARLAERARVYRRPPRRPTAHRRPVVTFDNDAVATPPPWSRCRRRTRMGVLYRITRALAELDLDIRSAKVQTLGQRSSTRSTCATPTGHKVTDPESSSRSSGRLHARPRGAPDAR